MIDTLELYAPTLKGLGAVHAFATESLECLVFDSKIPESHVAVAAYLYGKSIFVPVADIRASYGNVISDFRSHPICGR